ncbi:MAG TPA: glycosyltransferase family 8 protein [Devosiaceae bacterium]|nr:glycosyltransferase family 8 protein [Devosiaceae bacterium]
MDQPRSRTIHVALNFNDRYWALAYTVMRSICLTTTRRRDLVFHLCHGPLSADHAAFLDRIGTEFPVRLCHHDPETDAEFGRILDQLPTTERFPRIVYGRLLLDRLLPREVERVLYLDCDVMVRRPIEELYDLDLEGMAIGAVADPYHDGIKLGRDIRTKQSPFDSAQPYFNSGVLLIDRAAFAAADLPGRIAEFARTGLLSQLYFDQDILNLVFAGNWLELPWRFNLLEPRKPHESLGPVILHYTGHRRPWWPYSGVAFSRTYRHVMTNEVFYRQLRERIRGRLGSLIGRRP